MKKIICLLMATALLLTGCGGAAPTETEAPETEPVATMEPTTEPTTAPTEPKTFFEEQGFAFWEGMGVYHVLDENGNKDDGICARDNVLDSNECKVTINSGGREVTTYHLADTSIAVEMKEYTLGEFDVMCSGEKLLSTENIKNASDSLFKAFKEDDNSLTKDAWLEQYQDYKVIHCQVDRTIRVSKEVQNAIVKMQADQNRWKGNWYIIYWNTTIMNTADGTVYETIVSHYPGVAETFMLTTETGSKTMAAVADYDAMWVNSGIADDCWLSEDIFVMLPADFEDLTFVLPLVDSERTLEAFDATWDGIPEMEESAWEEKTYLEYVEGSEHLKCYFLSPYHH